ncbi:MAG: hypothetical protein KDH93_14450 [Rhodoferax sp.]|nr:hypothetical protein [Rhodoferax sp.]
MKDNTIQTQSPNVVDHAAESASRAIHSTQQAADHAFEGLDHKVQQLREQASPRYEDAAERTQALADHGLQTMRETSRRLRESAHQVTDGTRQYVRAEPVKSVLIAAATGALLMGVASLLARSGR